MDPLGQNIQPHTEQKVRDCLSGLFQERLESFLLGKLLSAYAVEHLANFAFRHMDVQVGRFAEHPVGGDQESHSPYQTAAPYAATARVCRWAPILMSGAVDRPRQRCRRIYRLDHYNRYNVV